MQRFAAPKHFIFILAVVLVLYLALYNGIEHLRTRKGPWQVTFTNEANIPELIINEPKLNLLNFKIRFPHASAQNVSTNIFFAQPEVVPFPVPFGQCVFEDTTFLPGTVAFKLFGQDIQLMPRTLTINHKEYPWQSNQSVSVDGQ